MKKIFYLLTVTLFLIISSCNPHNDQNQKTDHKAGIVFCIDDYYVEDFYQENHYNYIQSTGIKLTYFICQYHKLSHQRKHIIKMLQADGHEIGFHGTHHIHAADYLEDHTIDQYLNYEIVPDLKKMQQDGLQVTDFSYPFGSHTPKLDSILLNKYFYFIKLGTTKHFYYSTEQPKGIIRPICLDERYWVKYHITLDDILSFIDSAAAQNKVIIFYSHRLTDEYTTEYNATWFDKFRLIMNYAKEKGMQFYTLNDLKKLGKPEKLILNYTELEEEMEDE